MNIRMDANVALPFDENQIIGVRKSGLKRGLQQQAIDSGVPTKAKGLGGSTVKKQRRALGDVSESQINSRQTSSSDTTQKGSKLEISVTKPSAKVAAPKIFVEKKSFKSDELVDTMTCSGLSNHQRDLHAEADRRAAARFSSSKPGFHPTIDLTRSSSSHYRSDGRGDGALKGFRDVDQGLQEQEGGIDELMSSGSFLSDILDDQAINDLLND